MHVLSQSLFARLLLILSGKSLPAQFKNLNRISCIIFITSGAAAEFIFERTVNPTLISRSLILSFRRNARKLFFILGLVSGVGCAALLQNCSVANS